MVTSRKTFDGNPTTRLLTAGQSSKPGLIVRLSLATALFVLAFIVAPQLGDFRWVIGVGAFVVGYVVRPIHRSTAHRKRDRALLTGVEYVNFILIAIALVAGWLVVHAVGWSVIAPALLRFPVRILATVFFVGIAVRDLLLCWRGV